MTTRSLAEIVEVFRIRCDVTPPPLKAANQIAGEVETRRRVILAGREQHYFDALAHHGGLRRVSSLRFLR